MKAYVPVGTLVEEGASRHGKKMDSTSGVYVSLSGVPLVIQLQWPFHKSSSGADFWVLHGSATLGDGSGLHAEIAIHLTQVVAGQLSSLDPQNTLGPIVNALRKETDRKQLEFLRSNKRQPVPLGSRFQNFGTKAWQFEAATDEQLEQAILDRVFWAGSKLSTGPVLVADPVEALYLGTSTAKLAEVAGRLASKCLLKVEGGNASATDELLARSGQFESRAHSAIEAIQRKHAYEQEKQVFTGASH